MASDLTRPFTPIPGPYPIDVLASDFMARGTDAEHVLAHAASLTIQIDEIASELASLQRSIIALQDRRSLLERLLAVDKALIAPIRTLPTELLSRIFSFFSARRIGDEDNQPHTMLRVCRQWNQVAMATPGLWTSIYRDFRFIQNCSPEDDNRIIAHLRKQIALSGSQPLSIDLRNCNSASGDPLHSLSRLIVAEIGRTELLCISAPRQFGNTVINLVQNTRTDKIFAPFLREVREHLCTYFAAGTIIAPQLIYLEVDNEYQLPECTGYSMLRALRIRQLGYGDKKLVDVFSPYSHLEELQIDSISYNESAMGSDMLLPNLKHITVGGVGGWEWEVHKFVTLLDTRNLLSFSSSVDDLDFVRLLLEKPMPSLKSLRLQTPLFTENFDPIRTLTNLEEISIVSENTLDLLLRFLTPAIDDHPTLWPLPRLARLHDRGYYPTEVGDLMVRLYELRGRPLSDPHGENHAPIGYSYLCHLQLDSTLAVEESHREALRKVIKCPELFKCCCSEFTDESSWRSSLGFLLLRD